MTSWKRRWNFPNSHCMPPTFVISSVSCRTRWLQYSCLKWIKNKFLTLFWRYFWKQTSGYETVESTWLGFQFSTLRTTLVSAIQSWSIWKPTWAVWRTYNWTIRKLCYFQNFWANHESNQISIINWIFCENYFVGTFLGRTAIRIPPISTRDPRQFRMKYRIYQIMQCLLIGIEIRMCCRSSE